MSCIPESWTLKTINCTDGSGSELVDTVTNNISSSYSKEFGVYNLLDIIYTQEQVVSTGTRIDYEYDDFNKVDNVLLRDELCVIPEIDPVSSTQWRMRIIDTSGSEPVRLYEIEFSDSNIPVSVTATSTDGTNIPGNAIDTNLGTYWGGNSASETIEFTFATPVALTGYSWYSASAINDSKDPYEWYFEYFDGVQWQEVQHWLDGIENGSEEWQQFTFNNGIADPICVDNHLVDVISTSNVASFGPTQVSIFELFDYLSANSPLNYIYSEELIDNLGVILNQEVQDPVGVIVSLTDFINARQLLDQVFIPLEYFYLLADTINATMVLNSADSSNSVLLRDELTTGEDIRFNSIYSLLDAIKASDKLKLATWYASLTDTLSIQETLVFGYFSAIVDTINLEDSHRIQYHLLELIQVLANIYWIESYTLEDTFEAVDEIFNIISDVLDDNIDVEVQQLIYRSQDLLDTLRIDTSLVLINYNDLHDLISIEEEITPLGIYNLLLEDKISLDVFIVDKDSIISYVLNPRTKSIVNYDHWDFNSYTRFNNVTYGANDTGLYEITGDQDNGTYIDSYMKFATLSFGNTEMKSMEQAYVSMNGTGNIILTIEDEYGTKVHYNFTVRDNLHMNRIKLPKGLISKYFVFELMDTESTSFDLDNLELQPIQMTRKMR